MDGRDHAFGVLDDVVIGEPEGPQAVTGRRIVPVPILPELPRGEVELQPVDFHNDPTLDEEVHPSDTVDVDLGLHVESRHSEQHASNGLKWRSGTRIDVAKEGSPSPIAPTGQPLPHEVQVQPGLDSGLDDDEGFERSKAVQRVDHDLQLRGDESMTRAELWVMCADAVGKTMVVRREVHLARIIEAPETVVVCC
jgi:hypothetical protein